jgi:hypothetical protein
VHNYFSHDKKPVKIVCVQCVSDLTAKRPYTLSKSSGSSTLNHHLEVTYNITGTGAGPIEPNQTTLGVDGNLDIHNKMNDDQKGEILKYLVGFIVDDKQEFLAGNRFVPEVCIFAKLLLQTTCSIKWLPCG